MNLEELIKTVYSENDFSRSIATALAGVAGLLSYNWRGDWVISAFTAMVVFPVTRIIAQAVHTNWASRQEKSEKQRKLREQFDRYSSEEKKILRFFVEAGGACVSWGYVNTSPLPFPRPALNSLMQRGVICTSVMEDGMAESFVLDIDVFDIAQNVFSNEQAALEKQFLES